MSVHGKTDEWRRVGSVGPSRTGTLNRHSGKGQPRNTVGREGGSRGSSAQNDCVCIKLKGSKTGL